MYIEFRNWIELQKLKSKWKKQNKHNRTEVGKLFDIDRVHIGENTYGTLNVYTFWGDNSELRIGRICSIAENVSFIVGGEHKTHTVSSFPFKQCLLGTEIDSFGKGNIIVEDDVWFGFGSTILSGVHIGQGAVIAAGALVTKDVPPYAVVGGVPAKVIKYRFEPDIIDELMKVDYGKLSKEMIEEHIDDLYQELTDVKQLDWMPRR